MPYEPMETVKVFLDAKNTTMINYTDATHRSELRNFVLLIVANLKTTDNQIYRSLCNV